MATTPAPEFLTRPAAARRYNCSVRQIDRLIAAGKLPAYRVSDRLVRIDPAELEAAIRAQPVAGHANKTPEGASPQVNSADDVIEHIRRLVGAAPPLTAEQRDRLAVLLRGGDAA